MKLKVLLYTFAVFEYQAAIFTRSINPISINANVCESGSSSTRFVFDNLSCPDEHSVTNFTKRLRVR